MASCENCWDGKHWRCGGRDGCTCDICTKPHRKVVKQTPRAASPAYTRERRSAATKRVHDARRAGRPTYLLAEDEAVGYQAAAATLEGLSAVVLEIKSRRQLSWADVAAESGVNQTSLQQWTAGRMPNGPSHLALTKLIAWILKHTPTEGEHHD